MRRQPGESVRKWTSRFEAFIKKTGKALNQAHAEIDETTFLHPLIQGIPLLECSSLSPAENAAVLATSGATTKEGGSIGNSYLHVDLAASFIALWDNETLMRTETYASHCRCSNDDVGSIFPVECFFLEQDTVDGGEWETALGTYDEPWEDQSWEEPEEAQALDDDWADELLPEDPELEDQFGFLEAAEAYAVAEFKNASSDVRNATRTFMEAKDLVSRVKHARGYFPVVGVGAFDGFQTITPRGSRQTGSGNGASTGMNSQAGKGRGRGLGKKNPPRDSRRPSPAKSRVTSTRTAKGGHMGLEFNQVSVCSVAKWDMVSSACVVKCETRLFCWDSERTRITSTSLSITATYTSDSADHREWYEVDQGFSLINSLQHFKSFDEGHIIPTVHSVSITFGGSLCRVGSLCGGRRQRLCVAGHWSIQISWRLHDGAVCD